MHIFAKSSIVKNVHTYKGETQAHLCISCWKMHHLDKTHTSKRGDIFVVCCTLTNKHTTDTHTFIPCQFMGPLHNTHTNGRWTFLQYAPQWIMDTRIKVKHKHVSTFCRKMGHFDKTCTIKRSDIVVVHCTQIYKHTKHIHVNTYLFPTYTWVNFTTCIHTSRRRTSLQYTPHWKCTQIQRYMIHVYVLWRLIHVDNIQWVESGGNYTYKGF